MISRVKIALFSTLIVSSVYLVGYFVLCDIFVVTFQRTPMTFRLYDHEWERQLYCPLIYVESALRRGEFYGQTRSGASLPYPDKE
jgi:hypothetical protein